MRKVRYLVPIGLALIALASCTNPLHLNVPAAPSAKTIADAAHEGDEEHFYFLAPLVDQPTFSGVFDDGLAPVVRVVDQPAGAVLAEWAAAGGSGPDGVRLVPEEEHYIVNWHTKDYGLSAGATYRIQVYVPVENCEILVGWADVAVVDSGGKLKNIDTDAFVALKDGRTLPIKFRIEQGARIRLPVAAFTTSPESGYVPLEVAFDGSSSSDADGDALSYTWDFGDGSNGSGVQVAHTYSEPGTFTVILTVADGRGGVDSVSHDIVAETNLNRLVAYYPFNGNGNDESGNGNDGTAHGATLTTDRFGSSGKAYEFSGSNAYIDVPNSASLNPTQAITVTAWFNLHSFSCPYPPIVKKSDNTQSHGYGLECHFGLNGTDGVFGPGVMFDIDVSAGNGIFPWCASALTLNNWHQAVGVYDGSTIRFIVDGVQVSSHPLTGEIVGATNNLNIGRDPSNTGRYFDGLIDDVRIYNYALTTAEVINLYESEKPPITEMVQFAFDTDTTGVPPAGWTEWYDGNRSREQAAAEGLAVRVDDTMHYGSSGKSAQFIDETTAVGCSFDHPTPVLSKYRLEYYMMCTVSNDEGIHVGLQGDVGTDYNLCFDYTGYIGVHNWKGNMRAYILPYQINKWYHIIREMDLTSQSGTFYVEEVGNPENHATYSVGSAYYNTYVNSIYMISPTTRRAGGYIDQISIYGSP